MRVGIMMRHLGEHGGGVSTYTRCLLGALFSLASNDTFILFYASNAELGRFGPLENVTEVVLKAPSKFVWDQVYVPLGSIKYKIDVLFNPKYSLPLAGAAPGIFVCHGLDWYIMPWGSRWFDRLSHKFLIPQYVQRAHTIIAVSESVRQECLEIFGLAPEKVQTVHSGLDPRFREPLSKAALHAARARFGLPERYFLYVGQIYPPKNFGRLVRAFAQVGPRLGMHLVIAGEHRWLSEAEHALLKEPSISPWVRELGWVRTDHLPGIYANATALLLPSLYEGFGFPILEAMACGCPVITSGRYAMKELANGAALLVDPEDTGSIAAAMRQLAEDESHRHRLIVAGTARSKTFTWQRSAEAVLGLLREASEHKMKTVPLAGRGW